MMNRKGFTLIELMIVIAIIGILAAMAMPNFQKSRWQARQKACYSNMRVITSAVEMYNMDTVPMMDSLSLGDLSTGRYIKNIPYCPENPTTQTYSGTNLTTTGYIICGSAADKEFPSSTHGPIEPMAKLNNN